MLAQMLLEVGSMAASMPANFTLVRHGVRVKHSVVFEAMEASE